MSLIVILKSALFIEHYASITNLSPVSFRSAIGAVQNLYFQTNSSVKYEGPISPSMTIITIFTFVGVWGSYISGGIANMMCICGAYSIYEIVNELPVLFNDESYPTYYKILTTIRERVLWVNEINNTVKYVVLFEFMYTLLSTPNDFFLAIDGKIHTVRRIVNLNSRIFNLLTLWIAAESVEKVKCFSLII